MSSKNKTWCIMNVITEERRGCFKTKAEAVAEKKSYGPMAGSWIVIETIKN